MTYNTGRQRYSQKQKRFHGGGGGQHGHLTFPLKSEKGEKREKVEIKNRKML